MKKLILLSLLVMSVFASSAQRVYFVYLQTDSREPFFVRMDEQVYSSAAEGYLILSKLKDSVYNFRVGFPGKDLNLSFSATINKKDHGYLIKNFGERGWGLYDLQTMAIQYSSSAGKTAQETTPGEVNAFTDLLSKAADDPSLKQNVVTVKQEEKKPEATQAVVKETKPATNPPADQKKEETKLFQEVVKDNKADNNASVVVKTEEKKVEPIVSNKQPTEEKKADSSSLAEQKVTDQKTVPERKEEPYRRSQVLRTSSTKVNEGVESIYIDQYADGSSDTIRIIVPQEQTIVVPKEEPKTEVKKEERKFLDINTDVNEPVNKPPTEVKKEDTKPAQKSENKTVISKPAGNCKSAATDEDFLKLRRRMASRTNDDAMLDEARKYFKAKCFSTDQIRNLSSMFLSNAGKYHFFDAAYNYVTDISNFPSLESELKDDYYINRFKAMLQ